MKQKVVIVGAGHAGGTMATTLRQLGFSGDITLIGEEPLLPYQRPPLSKAWLKGETDADALALRPAAFYEEHGVNVLTSTKVKFIDRLAKSVTLEDCNVVAYDFLVLATGALPIRLNVDVAGLDGIHVLRTAGDAERLKADLGEGRRLAVIGGGYIGLEVAATATALGSRVFVIERERRLLLRSGSEIVARFFCDYHERRGVSISLGASVTGFDGDAGRVSGIKLSDGKRIDCDCALIGVGITPNVRLASGADLHCERGIVVDSDARTSDASIFAIGDCTRRPIAFYGGSFCLESVPNALEQVKQAAAAILALPRPKPEVPWNWSDQYDLKLQIAGLSVDIDRVVVRGDIDSAHFAVFHLRGDQIQQVEAVNSAPEFVVGRQLIGSRVAVDPVRLANSSISMRDVTV